MHIHCIISFEFLFKYFMWCMTQIHWGGREQKIPVGQTFHQIFLNCFMFHSSFMLLHICILHVMKDFFLQISIFCVSLGCSSVHDGTSGRCPSDAKLLVLINSISNLLFYFNSINIQGRWQKLCSIQKICTLKVFQILRNPIKLRVSL